MKCHKDIQDVHIINVMNLTIYIFINSLGIKQRMFVRNSHNSPDLLMYWFLVTNKSLYQGSIT